jgi:hypothetical protein
MDADCERVGAGASSATESVVVVVVVVGLGVAVDGSLEVGVEGAGRGASVELVVGVDVSDLVVVLVEADVVEDTVAAFAGEGAGESDCADSCATGATETAAGARTRTTSFFQAG